MVEWVEQQIYIKFCIKLEHFSMKTFWMIQKAFRNDVMSSAQTKAWHKCFKDGWESVESVPCSGRPETSRTPDNVECTGYNQQRSASDSARIRSWSGDSRNYCSEILMWDLGMKRVRAKFVLQLLLPEQKKHRAAVANDLIRTTTSKSDFLKVMMLGHPCEVPRCLLWRGLRRYCPVDNVSYIFFNKCFYLS